MDIRDFFFRNRSYTPLPLAIAIFYFADREGALLLPGIGLVAVGELLRISAVRYAGGATRTRHVGAKALCMSGPFAHLRNPLYLGNMIIYTGIVLLAGGAHLWIMLAVTLLFFVLQYGLIISLEEQTLHELFGDEYRAYVRAVPRLVPRPTPWRKGRKTEPLSLARTLRTERRTLQTLVAALVLLAVRLFWLW